MRTSRVLSAMKVRKTPLPASWLKNATPAPLPPSGRGAASRRAIPMTRGKTAVTASSSRFLRRRNTSLSSAVKNLREARTGRGASPAATLTSAVDIEALPGEADEQVFQARRGDREAADTDPGVHELGADLFRR